MKSSTNTEKKYLNFLSTLSARQRGFGSLGKVVKNSRISSIAATVLKNRSLVEKANGTWKWSGPTPDRQMAKAVIGEVNSIITGYVNKKNGVAPPAKRAYTKRINTNPVPCPPKTSCNDTLSISSLKSKKEALVAQIAEIDTVISVVEKYTGSN